MIKRSNTPVNPPKVEHGQAPRRTYHNKLAENNRSAQKNSQQNLQQIPKQKPCIRNQSQKHLKPTNQQAAHLPIEKQRQKQSTAESTEANSPKSMQIKQYLKSKAPRIISDISSDLSNAISKEMRELVISWIVEICHKMPLKSQTLFHCVLMFDSIIGGYRTITDNFIVVCVENLQLLALACLFISAKYQQIYPPPADLLVKVADYTYSKKKLIQMQASILLHKQFILTFPTRHTFLNQFLAEEEQFSTYSENKMKRLEHICLYLSQLSLLELWEDSTEEELAEAIIFLGKKIAGVNVESVQNKKVYKLAGKVMQQWKNYQGSIISYIFDTDQYSFVGGIYLQDI